MTDCSRIALVWLVALAHVTAARAQPRDLEVSLRIDLRVQSELDVRLADRLRGQTSDLPIDIQVYQPARAALGMSAALEQALAHCRESRADVVVWLLPGRAGNGWQLVVVTCRDQRSLLRRIDGARPALSGATETQSGVLETAALLLRGVLSFLARGGVLEVGNAQAVRSDRAEVSQPPPSAASASSVRSDPAEASQPPPSAASTPSVDSGWAETSQPPPSTVSTSSVRSDRAETSQPPPSAASTSSVRSGRAETSQPPPSTASASSARSDALANWPAAESGKHRSRDALHGDELPRTPDMPSRAVDDAQASAPQAPDDPAEPKLGSAHAADSGGSVASSRGGAPPSTSRPEHGTGDVLLMLGWQDTWENARHALSQPAIASTLALGGGRFKLGLTGSFSFGNTYSAAHTSLRIARHTLAAQARLNLVQRDAWSVSSGLDLGAVLYARSTRELDSLAMATPSALFAEPLLSAWLTAGAHIGPLWIVLAGGFEVLPWTPQFVFLRNDGGERPALQISPIAPRATLSLALGRP